MLQNNPFICTYCFWSFCSTGVRLLNTAAKHDNCESENAENSKQNKDLYVAQKHKIETVCTTNLKNESKHKVLGMSNPAQASIVNEAKQLKTNKAKT